MNTIEINQGYLVIRDGKSGHRWNAWCDDKPDPRRFPYSCDQVYKACQTMGYTQEQTIDKMLKIFHRQRIIRGGFLEAIPLVTGFIGNAGAGKSCGAVGVAVWDYMLAGWNVVSNMEIQVRVKYRDCEKIFRTENLGKLGILDVHSLEHMYRNVLIFWDEINMGIDGQAAGDARRSMSNANLSIGAFLQSRRKRNTNVIWTTQSESWIDNRIRFGSDLYIQCRDAAYDRGWPTKDQIGRRSHWTIWDMSGRVTGRTPDLDIDNNKINKVFPFKEKTFGNTLFWNCYDSWQLQGIKGQNEDAAAIQVRDGEALKMLKDKHKVGREVAGVLIDQGVITIPRGQLWKTLGIENDKSMQTIIGRDFKAMGIRQDGYRENRYYIIQDQNIVGG